MSCNSLLLFVVVVFFAPGYICTYVMNNNILFKKDGSAFFLTKGGV